MTPAPGQTSIFDQMTAIDAIEIGIKALPIIGENAGWDHLRKKDVLRVVETIRGRYVPQVTPDIDAIEPRANRNQRSRDAAASMRFPARGLRRTIMELIDTEGPRATWQLEQRMDGLHQSISPRVNELAAAGFLTPMATNITPSGRTADIYGITALGHEHLRGVR